jgi:hypothetical protein
MVPGVRRALVCVFVVVGVLVMSGAGVADTSLELLDPAAGVFFDTSVPVASDASVVDASRERFESLDAAGALQVASAEHPEVLDSPVWAGVSSDARVVRYLDDRSAVVSEDGARGLVTSALPLRDENAAGQLAPVSLDLVDRGESWGLENPLASVSLPKEISDGVLLEDAGVEVGFDGSASGRRVEGRVFYANVARDTDLVLEPVPSGVEASWLLRSQESPSDLTMSMDAPVGAELETLPGDVGGGVRVVRDGVTIAAVPGAHAWDADGIVVPTSTDLEDGEVHVRADLSGQVRFPVVVESACCRELRWVLGCQWLAAREHGVSEARGLLGLVAVWPGSLPLHERLSQHLSGSVDRHGTVAVVGAGWHELHLSGGLPERLACRNDPNPTCRSAGIVSAQGVFMQGPVYNSAGQFVKNGDLTTCNGPTSAWFLGSHTHCVFSNCAPAPNDGNGVSSDLPGNRASFSMMFQNTGVRNTQAQLYLANSIIYLSDGETPTVTSVTGFDRWGSGQPFSLTVSAQDGVSSTGTAHGLGMGGFRLKRRNTDGSWTTVADAPNPCYGTRLDRCPFSAAKTFTVDPAQFPGGRSSVGISAYDIVGHEIMRPAEYYDDHTPPALNISGPLWDARNSTIGRGTVPVGVDAFDDSDLDDISASGVVSVELTVDGVDPDPAHDHVTQTCTAGDCTLSADFTVDTNRMSGSHTFRLIAADRFGNRVTKSWSVSVSGDFTSGPTFQTAPSTLQSEMSAAAQTAVGSLQSAAPAVLATSTSATDSAYPYGTVKPKFTADFTSSLPVQSDGVESGVAVPTDPTAGFSLNTAWGPLHVQALGLARTAETGVIVNGTTTVFPAAQQSTDVAVRPTALGVASYTQIRDASAPEAFTWKLDLTYDEALRQLADGSVAVVAQTDPTYLYSDLADLPGITPSASSDPGEASTPPSNPGPAAPYDSVATPVANSSGSSQLASAADTSAQINRSDRALAVAAPLQTASQWIIAVIRAPWAVDANGQALPTALSVHNDTITMTVLHRGRTSAYPVIADPDMSDCAPGHSPCGDFNISKAVAYAWQWRDSRNPSYPAFEKDCTNYLSQIMRAGNMELMREADRGKGSWWFKRGFLIHPWVTTHSWSVSQDFVHHMLAYGLMVYHRGDYRPGDVLAWVWNSDSNTEIEHLNFVQTVRNGMPYLLQHTTDYAVARAKDKFEDSINTRTALHPFRRYHLRPVHTGANIT